MSADDPQIQNDLGFRLEDTEDTDPIVDGDETFYKFGRYHLSFGNFPELITNEVAMHKGSDYDAYKLIAAGTEIQFAFGFQVLHGILIFMMNCRKESTPGLEDGGVVDNGSNVYTITPITSGDLQTYTIRWHTSNGTVKIQKSVTGCLFHSLTFTLDLMTHSALVASLIGKGKYMQPVVVNTETDYSLIVPDNLDELFYPDDNMIFTFNSVDLTDYVEFISFTLDTLNWLDGSKDSHQPEEALTGNRIPIMTFRIRRADEVTVFDAYMAQAGAKGVSANILNDMVFQIFNRNSKYLKFNLNNCLIKSCKLNDANLKKGEMPFYEVVVRATKVTYVNFDGVTTLPLYGISA